MKPYSLRLQAFGPFSSSVQVSFAKVHRGGLFLIHGATGSGKTSLLDGMTFALFGRSSSAERDKDISGLRSDAASAKDVTECELIFSIGEVFYRVLRRPTQTTEKLKGQGLRELKAQAELYRYQGPQLAGTDSEQHALLFTVDHWVPVALKVDQVTAAVEQLLGMTEKQFRQVILLPQGKFREFLSASSAARQDILERLFQTERYSDFEQFLSASARDLEQSELKLALSHEAQIAALPESMRRTLQSANSIDLHIEQLALTISEQQNELEKKDSERQSATKERAQTETALNEAQSKKVALERLERAYQRWMDLEQNAAVYSELEARIEMSIENAPIFQWIHRREDGLKQIDTLKAEKVRLDQGLSQLQKTIDQNRESLREKSARLQSIGWTEELQFSCDLLAQSLLELKTKADLLKTLKDQLEIERKSYQNGVTQRAQLLETLLNTLQMGHSTYLDLLEQLDISAADNDARIKAIESEERNVWRQRFLQEAHDHPDHQCPVCLTNQASALASEGLKTISASARDSQRLEDLQNVKLKIERIRAQLNAGWDSIEKAVSSLNEDQLKNALKNRPQPIDQSPSNGSVNDRKRVEFHLDIKPFESEVQALTSELNKLRTQTELLASIKERGIQAKDRLLYFEREYDDHARTCQQQIEQLRTQFRVTEFPSLELTPSDIQLSVLRLKEWMQSTQKKSQLLKSECDHLQANLIQAESRFATLQDRLQTLNRGLIQLDTDIQSFEREIATALEGRSLHFNNREGDLTSIEAQIDWLNNQTLEPKALAHSRQQLTQFKSSRADSLNTLRRLAHDSAVFSKDEAESLKDAQILDQMSRFHFRTEIDQIAGLTTELSERVQRVKQRELALTSERDEASSTVKSLERVHQNLVVLKGQKEALSSEQKSTVRLAGLFKGDRAMNRSGVPFSRFVLQTRFDQILENANLRLKSMTKGQFLLKRAQTAVKMSQSQGLALEVEDLLTGTLRQADSLSGGESFMASLALALGLADTVQSELGGIQIESVFIDEGFGTLDPEALDLAIQTLVDAQSAGRVVGIISHVNELKAQIPMRLEVLKSHRFDHQRQVRWSYEAEGVY